MNKSITIFLILLICGSVGSCEKNEDKLIYRNDIKPIEKRLRGLPKIVSTKWIGEAAGKDSRLSPPRNGSYRMYGYAVFPAQDLNSIGEKYEWRKAEGISLPFAYLDYDKKSYEWVYSEDFNKNVKSPLLLGKLYVCFEHGLIYFHLEGE